MKKRTRLIAAMLAALMLLSCMPAAAAYEPEHLPEGQIDDAYVTDGLFYLASAGAEINENAGRGYLLKVARWGNGEEAASVRLTMTDITASYGEDYTISLYDADLLEGTVKNSKKSESILEYLQSHETEEYNYSDAIIDGTIAAEDQLADGEDNVELTEEQKSEIEAVSNELMASLAGTTPDEVETIVYDAGSSRESAGSALSAAREKATGLKDDREPVAYGAPAVSGTGSSSDSGAYMTDSIAEVSNALNASYIVINFDEGITERYVEILPRDNSKSDGNRQSNFGLDSEDGSEISGMYGSFTLKLIDDEPYVPDVIEFSDTEYYPEDGFVTVTVRRTGNLTGVLTAMLYTADDTAVSGLDYSTVDAKLTFGFGVSERVVKIPVRSDYLKADVRFKLILSEPQECIIGEKSTASCVIRKNDTSFKLSAESDAALRTGALGATQDMDLDSVMVGEEFCLPDMYQGCYLTNGDCRSVALGENGWQLYAHKHGDDVEAAAAFALDSWHYDYSGYEVFWSRRAGKPTWGSTKFWSFTGGINVDTLYNKDTERWSNNVDQYFLDTDVTTLFEFHLYAETGLFATNPTLDIYYVKPILRPFRITMMGADPIELIDSNGNRVKNTEIASYATENEVQLQYADSSNSVVTTTGESVTVELRNNVSPICYISGIYLVNEETGEKVLVQSYPEGTTSAALNITNDLIAKNLKFVSFEKNGDHGKYGTFTIQPKLENMPATVHVEKSDRGTVTVWDGNIIPAVYSDSKETVYNCSVGDVIRYNVEVDEELTSMFDWERVEIDTLRPSNQQIRDIRRVTGQNYAQDVVSATEINAAALITDEINRVVVRVNQSDIDKFDTTTGIFTKSYEIKVAKDGVLYREYAIDANRVAGKNYELTAKVKDKAYVAEWCNDNNTAARFSQETFYYKAAADQSNNILLLSPKKADGTAYSLTGTVYYDDAALGGAVSAQAWYPASGAYYIIDSAHYGITDINGLIKTAPFNGIAGDYVRYKISAAGYEGYSDVLLKQQNLQTAEYDDGVGGTYTVSSYELNMPNRIVSATNMSRPHIKSVTAVSLLTFLSSSSVKINGMPTTFTVNVETVDPATGEPYTYTYENENGEIQTKTERPKAVDIVIIDPVTHEEKFVITGAKNPSDDGRTWKLSYTFSHDEYTKYKAGDLIYARLTTDRYIGDGCAENENGERIPVDAFRETRYVPVRTKLTLSGINPQEPQVLDIKIDPSNHIPQEGNYYDLPIIGDLTMMINACGLSFGISETETGGVRLFFGKQIMSLTKSSHFDGNGNPVSDAGFAIDSDNWRSSFSEMSDMINTMGNVNKLHAMSLGIPAWSIEPMAGIYLEFAVYNDMVSEDQDRLEFVGGGGYIGAIGSFRYTYYMVVYGVPVYVGGDVSLTLMGELGISKNPDIHIFYDEMDQEFLDKIIDNSHFQFIFMAMINANAYAGFGICGTLGLRGGFTLILKFIANPMVTKSYPSVRSSGFEVTGTIKFWADAVLLSVPIPAYTWELLKLGYFKDIDELKEDNPQGLLAPVPASETIYSKPRNIEESDFVGDRKVLQSTFSGISSRNIVENSYDDAQQKLIDLGDSRILMVYLDDDKARDDNERTALKYSVYSNGEWSTPVIIQNDGTADFSPDVCDAGNDVIISWVSRPEGTELNEYRDYLSSTEIYTVRMSKETLTLGSIERLTDDDYYDTDPATVYDSFTGDAVITYLKSEVGSINNSNDLLGAALPYTNGSVLMYMLYDGDRGEWVRDMFFPNEIANSKDADSLLEEFDGQRFVPTAAFGMTNPIISDLTSDTAVIANINAKDIENFNTSYAADKFGYTRNEDGTLSEETLNAIEAGGAFSVEDVEDYCEALNAFKNKWTKPYGLYTYTVDKDNNLSTDSDREVFVQLYDFETHYTWEPIQITNNGENDSNPQLIHVGDTAYLFWLHDGKEIRYINATDTMCEADSEGFVRYRTVTAKSADTDIDDLSISSFKAFADNNQNLFVAWQQNSAAVSEENAEFAPTQDIYLAGYVKYSDDTQSYSSWSDAIRMTDNSKLNDLPEFADLGGGRLMMVNSQYDIDMNGDIYAISNVNLVETNYATVGSLKVVDVVPRTIPKKTGDEFCVDIMIKNDGVKAESGFAYSGALMAGGHPVQQFDGALDASVPAGRTVTVTQKFTLPDNAADALDTLNIQMYIKENGTNKPILSGAPFFDGEPRYELFDIAAVQEGNCFRISGFARNVGSGKCDGTDRIDIYADGNSTALASVRLGAGSEIGTAVPFSAVVDIDPESAKYGFVNYALIAHSADNTPCSSVETIRAALVNPFNLCLNGNSSLDEITISKGQSLSLSTTYEPTTFYRNANAKYAIDDTAVATVNGNRLVGLEEGETALRVTIDPYGGSKTVIVKVGPKAADDDDDDDGVTVSVSGKENSVNAKATVSGSTATLQPIRKEELEKVIGDNVNTDMAEIDLSGLKQNITAVKLPTETVNAIAEAAAETENDTAGLALKLASGTLEFDVKALETIAKAAGNAKNIEIHFDVAGTSRLNADQKEAVSEMFVVEGFEVYVTVNGTRVSDFNGGSVVVYIPYEVPVGNNPAGYSVWYVAEDGTLENTNATYDGTNHRFVVTHFSDYVLTYDEEYSKYSGCPKDAACPIEKFTDTKNDAWWHDGIHYCLDNGLMSGMSETVFAPKGTTTRAQIATILWRLEGKPIVNYAMSFKDVAEDTWYTEAVRWAQSEKIVSGYDAGNFGPNDPVTREQLATILYRYAKDKRQGFTGSWMFLLDFVDRADISSWADEAVHWCNMKSIVTGKDGKVFDPRGNATRAEAASMIQRFCEMIEK